MRLTFPDPEIPEDGFTGCDIFGRKHLADSILGIADNIEDNIVLALDSPWGSGKSVFLKQFMNYAGTKGYPCIYLDAFKNDISQDAFVTITGEIIAHLDKVLGKKNAVRKKLKSTAIKVGAILAKGSVKIAASYLTAGLIKSSVIDDLTESEDAEKKLAGELSKILDDAATETIAHMVEQQAVARQTVETLQIAVSESAEKLIEKFSPSEGNNPHQRVFFIIDELDRCRPKFAIEIIEVIKHFYNVENVTFLVSADFGQLEQSVCHCYGGGIAADRYLEKFFDIRLYFATHNERQHTTLGSYILYIAKHIPGDAEGGEYSKNVLSLLATIGDAHNLQLRTFQKICQHFAMFLAQSKKSDLRVSPVIAVLCYTRVQHPEIYRKLLAKECSFEDLEACFQFTEKLKSSHRIGRFFSCLAYCLVSELSEDSDTFKAWTDIEWRFSYDRDEIFPEIGLRFFESFSLSQ